MGEERVRIGKGPRRIIGKKSGINGARVLELVFQWQNASIGRVAGASLSRFLDAKSRRERNRGDGLSK